MNGILVDSYVILDIFLDDPLWADWAEATLDQYGDVYDLCINPMVYTELSIGFKRIEELEKAIEMGGFQM